MGFHLWHLECIWMSWRVFWQSIFSLQSLQPFQKSLAGGYIWKVLLLCSPHVQVTIPQLLRFHLRGNLLLPFVLCVINGSYYFQPDPSAAFPKEQLRIWLYESLSLLSRTHPFTFDIYNGCGFLCNSLESSLNLKKVLVFLETPWAKESLLLDLNVLSWKLYLSDWKVFRGTGFVIFLS